MVGVVKTLHTAYRVSDLATSLDFYTALGTSAPRPSGAGVSAHLQAMWRP